MRKKIVSKCLQDTPKFHVKCVLSKIVNLLMLFSLEKFHFPRSSRGFARRNNSFAAAVKAFSVLTTCVNNLPLLASCDFFFICKSKANYGLVNVSRVSP